MKSAHCSAFTLVELSIVLVILGLLTGGILTGQSLIRAAELRSVVTEFQRYQAAVQTFRDKYRGLPGDITNATAFWGDGTVDALNPCDVPAGAPAHYDVCNGNGNGLIGWISLNNSTTTEIVQFWPQLALSGMIEGSYSGQDDMSYQLVLGTGKTAIVPLYYDETTQTTPTSRFNDLRWYTGYNDKVIILATPLTFQFNYGHYLIHGRSASSGINPIYTSTMKPEEVWSIDAKMDDGKPGIGKVLTYPVACTTVASATQGSTAEYLLTSTTGQCGVIFANAY